MHLIDENGKKYQVDPNGSVRVSPIEELKPIDWGKVSGYVLVRSGHWAQKRPSEVFHKAVHFEDQIPDPGLCFDTEHWIANPPDTKKSPLPYGVLIDCVLNSGAVRFRQEARQLAWNVMIGQEYRIAMFRVVGLGPGYRYSDEIDM